MFVLVLAVVTVAGVGAFLLLRPTPETLPVVATGGGTPAAPSVPGAAAPGPGTAPSSGSTATSCPSAASLAAAFGRAEGRSGVVARSGVTCAGGFATVKVRYQGGIETVGALFDVGPPVHFLATGSGPICTDDAGSLPGAVVVPRSAARALDCATTAGAPTSAAAPAVQPVLGTSSWGTPGFGTSRPAGIDYGGDATSSIHGIVWRSWGGARATGTGQALYASATAPLSDSAVPESAVVVAWDLGTCAGKPAYRKVQWFFPQHGQALTPATATAACL